MAVFWACLIATSNLQMCIPRWIVFAKGKFALEGLLKLVDGDEQGPQQQQRASVVEGNDASPPASPTSMTHKHSRVLRKITPQRCLGEMALHNVTFSFIRRERK